MFSTLIFSLIISVAATIFLAASPLFLGVWIIFLAFLIAVAIALFSTSWLGLIIFIIYVGGLLVIFAYFVALTPNLFIEGRTILSFLALSVFLANILLFLFPFSFPAGFSSGSSHPLSHLMSINSLIIIALAVVLFLALVAVVKICSTFSAPLRPFS